MKRLLLPLLAALALPTAVNAEEFTEIKPKNIYSYKKSSLVKEISFNEPNEFDNQWNGYGQLMFDKFEDYIIAKQPALDKAGPNGLELDDMVAKVGDDFEHLYSGSPFQFNVNETIIKPVMRPEHKLFKVTQFVKKNEVLPEILFNSYLKGAYSESLSKMDGLQGLIINQRTSLDVMTNFFNPESECFSKAGAQRRERFYENWDIIIEYWFNNSDYFFSSRFNKNLLSFTKKFEEKYLILTCKNRNDKIRKLRFTNPSKLIIEDGFYDCLTGMEIIDISSRQWGNAKIEVINYEQDPGITFLAQDMEIILDEINT